MYSQWRAVAIWALEMDISSNFFSGAFTFCSHLSLERGDLFRMSTNYQCLGLGWLFVYLQTAVFTSKMTSSEGQHSKLPKAKNIFEPQRMKQTFSGMKMSILVEAPGRMARASLKRSIPLAVWRMHTSTTGTLLQKATVYFLPRRWLASVCHSIKLTTAHGQRKRLFAQLRKRESW